MVMQETLREYRKSSFCIIEYPKSSKINKDMLGTTSYAFEFTGNP